MSKKTKKNIKVRDLNPKKDAKGGGYNQQGAAVTGAAVTGTPQQGAAMTGTPQQGSSMTGTGSPVR